MPTCLTVCTLAQKKFQSSPSEGTFVSNRINRQISRTTGKLVFRKLCGLALRHFSLGTPTHNKRCCSCPEGSVDF
eukprot:1191855-Prorocentrum_minimum.AAC.5